MSSIAEAAKQLGVSEKTIRRRIKTGILEAVLRGSPASYDVDLTNHIKGTTKDGRQKNQKDNGFAYKKGDSSFEKTEGLAREFIASLKTQLEKKDRQIGELHVLLQRAQEAPGPTLEPGRPGRRRSWWPFK